MVHHGSGTPGAVPSRVQRGVISGGPTTTARRRP